MNRYYVFADNEYRCGFGMKSCELRTKDKKEAFQKANKLTEIWELVSIWDVVEEKEIYNFNKWDEKAESFPFNVIKRS